MILKDRQVFDVLFRGLLEKDFPDELVERFHLPQKPEPPLKPYTFVMPKENLVFDYKFIREVRLIERPFINLEFELAIFFNLVCK